MATFLESWQPSLRERPRAKAMKSLKGVRLLHDFDWDGKSPGFGPNRFPGYKALAREISRLRVNPTSTQEVMILLTVDPQHGVKPVMLEDGAICFICSIAHLRANRQRRSTALLTSAFHDSAVGLTALAAASRQPAELMTLLMSADWDAQTRSLGSVEVAQYLPQVLRLARDTLQKLPEQTQLDESTLEILGEMLGTFVATARERGHVESVFKLFSKDAELALEWVGRNSGVIEKLMTHEIAERDITSLGYRRAQLKIFRTLLDDEAFFSTTRAPCVSVVAGSLDHLRGART